MKQHLINGDVMTVPLADQSVHCIVTSPPYWGLRSYSTGDNKALELGGEPLHDCGAWNRRQIIKPDDLSFTILGILSSSKMTRDKKDDAIFELVTENTISEPEPPCGECFVCHVRQYAREFWRVLRNDGVMWLNLGDSYAGGGRGGQSEEKRSENWQPTYGHPKWKDIELKPKDLCGIPWRVALALQADGWYLRSDIIWAKPNPMPESVTDRCTKSHEYLFLLTKNKRYYYDADAIRETAVEGTDLGLLRGKNTGNNDMVSWHAKSIKDRQDAGIDSRFANPSATRNRRTVWKIPTAPHSGAHFATFPPALVEPCIKAGTSERGYCPECGKQWVRVVEKYPSLKPVYGGKDHSSDIKHLDDIRKKNSKIWREHKEKNPDVFLGFRPDCDHDAAPVPCTVFDPFSGSGTTLMVANQLGRRGVGLDLSLEYIQLAKERIGIKALDAWVNGIDASEEVELGPLFNL